MQYIEIRASMSGWYVKPSRINLHSGAFLAGGTCLGAIYREGVGLSYQEVLCLPCAMIIQNKVPYTGFDVNEGQILFLIAPLTQEEYELCTKHA